MKSAKRDYNLREFNSFGLDSIAREFYEIDKVEELKNVLSNGNGDTPFVLGEGSNVLLPQFFDRTVITLNLKSWDIVFDNEEFAIIRVGAGGNWHQFVIRALTSGLGGIENLSLIPGTVGAAPIQNIGAYGVEVSDFVEEVEYFSFEEGAIQTFSAEECAFDYRNSIFKKELNGKGVITRVTFRLPKQGFYDLNTSYSSLAKFVESTRDLTAKKVSDAVISIRESKLPNPRDLGNAGSFFKNPIIPLNHFRELEDKFENIPSYPVSDTFTKIPAAWLIDYCGWKGKRVGDVGSYKKQPLVIVNFGGATVSDIVNWAVAIRDDVENQFDIELEPEVNILNSKGERVGLPARQT